ncbi:hypothetical protein BpHYR1_028068 [Brachionus plicatilis]|uniref:Uncharacterized protein n=1 Tax=Brachionus plicatilis TaxID=10195 RepID=A0A3M7R3X1_BRAPC|nr:hypothetical protein BpHYR1_028068 [Brachionus plicatilis]
MQSKSKQDGIIDIFVGSWGTGVELIDDNLCKFKESEETNSEITTQSKKESRFGSHFKNQKAARSGGSRSFSISKIYSIAKELRKQKKVSTSPTLLLKSAQISDKNFLIKYLKSKYPMNKSKNTFSMPYTQYKN